MAKNNDLIISKEIIDEVIKAKAYDVIDDIKQITDMAISNFYADYTPITHKNRKLDYHNVWGIRRPYEYKLIKISNGYKVVFDFDSAFVTGHDNPDIIFEGPFEQGYHGGPRRDGLPTPQTSPSPWEMIRDYVDQKYGS